MSQVSITTTPQVYADDTYRKAADRIHGVEGEIEIDDDAKISCGCDYGAYVQAWVFVYNAHLVPEDGDDVTDDDENGEDDEEGEEV